MHNGTCTKRYSGTQHAMSTGVTHERGDTKFDDVTMAKKLDDSLLETSLFDVGAQIHLRG